MAWSLGKRTSLPSELIRGVQDVYENYFILEGTFLDECTVFN
jgi:hypothetical protein